MTHAIVLLTCLAAPPTPPAVAKAEPAADLDKLFRRTDGWIGGDGAFSVPLSDARTLWLFSDTWVGSVRDGKRRDVTMVNNTVGVQEGNGADAKITFAIRKGDDGKHTAIFVPPDGKGWFWPFAGYHAGGKLHVFLPKFEKTGAAGAFGFRNVDLWLGTVSNPGDDPTKWKTEYAKVPFAGFGKEGKRSFGSALLRVGDHVYVYGYDEPRGKGIGRRRLTVARVPAGKLGDFSAWRFRREKGWSADADDAAGFAAGLATEFSVTPLPKGRGYVLVYTENGLGERIVARFASVPDGPFSAPVLLYKCPEMAKDKGVFCYSAKAHAWAAGGDELIVSYCVNAWDFGRLFRDEKVYRPRFVRVTLRL